MQIRRRSRHASLDRHIKYGYLASIAPSVSYGTVLLQGDAIGTQGNTGNTLPPSCGVHLHWEFGGISYGSPVPTIDGGLPTSSNSLIGEYSTAGATLRTYYTTHGGWNSIGWTYKQCPGACTLDMTANKVWGRMQDFQHDPDLFGGTFDTILVSAWNTTQAYLVDSVFWQLWGLGGTVTGGGRRPISIPLQERGACPPGAAAGCISHQRFHLGYEWMNTMSGRESVFCPDLDLHDGVDLTDARCWRRLAAPIPTTMSTVRTAST